ncbi:MAG: T9SS type A sorting domain-containing protein, partial [Candidatus Marinimicrobia bacterium]|nr:T9SS type A sorting domain-containing protein [Candidatus Neomarinimicrobiota bacterium]
PEAFALLSPGHESTLVITGANLGDTLTFAWDRAVDVDGDIVHYGADLTDGFGLLFTFGDTTGTEVRLPHADLVAIMEGLGQFTLTGTWDIFATDGHDSTWASNGPFTLTIDATTLGILRQELLPGRFALRQNYPNPFNPSTTVRFDLPLAASVRLAVYDLLGREVVRLVDGHLEAGYHQQVWSGRDRDGQEVPTGIYFVRLVSGEFSAVRKMILMK